MKRTCNECGTRYETTDKRRKFCSTPCYWAKARRHPNRSAFKTGTTPWNANTKGLMKPNSGSFQTGRKSETRADLGAVRIRTDKQGHARAWVKAHEKGHPSDWRLRAVIRWEKYRGNLKKGWLVHHKDRDTLNDRLKNLQAMSRSEHFREHWPEFEQKARRAASNSTRKRHAENRAKRRADASS